MLIEVVLLIGGLVLLYYGAEWLVTGSSKLAFELGISPLIIGLTVVAFGTSAPELVVTGAASLQDSSDVSLGNIVGSNICNIALVLGAAAVIRPVHVDQATVRRDYPVMLGASAALYGMAWLGEVVDRVDGALLLTAMMGFTFYTVRLARRAMRAHKEATEAVGDVEVDDLEDGPSGTAANVGLVAIGVIGLVIGAELMVSSAIAIATALSVPEFVIAVSVVAFGTSLPELATSVVAAIRDESDISVGNIIGSNIFNVLWIVGLVGLVFQLPVDSRALSFDFPIMLGITVLLYPVLRTGFYVGRGKGGLLLAIYVGYVAGLFFIR